MTLLKGDYLNHLDGEWITVVEDTEEPGKHRVKVVASVPFEPEWKSLSLRGYHKFAVVPDGVSLDMSGAVEAFGGRISENGAIFFYLSRAERDANFEVRA